jgi:hypothetical protein
MAIALVNLLNTGWYPLISQLQTNRYKGRKVNWLHNHSV